MVGDRDRLAGHGGIRRGGQDRAGWVTATAAAVGLPAEVVDPDVLDFRSGKVALRVGRLDVIVEQFAPESGQVGVGDFDKIVIRHRVGLHRQEVIDLVVGRRRVERLARLGQFALGHVERHPRPHLAAAGVSFVLIARQWIGAVVVDADFQLHLAGGNTTDVISVRPDIELRIHPLEKRGVAPGHIVEPTERVGPRIVGETLRFEHGGRGAVVVAARRRHPRGQFFHGTPRGQPGLHLVVIAEPAVVVETGIEALEINMPGEFDLVGIVPPPVPFVRRLDVPGFDRTALVAQDLFSRFAPVGPGHQGRVAVKFEGEARCFQVDLRAGHGGHSPVSHRGHRRLDPLEEGRGPVIHLGKNPRAILDVDHRDVVPPAGGADRGIDEILRRALPVTSGTGLAEKLRGRLEPGTGSAAPCVVAIGRRHDQNRPAGVRGVGRDELPDFANSLAGVAVAVAEHVVGRHGIHGCFRPGFRVHIFDPVQLVSVRRDIPGRVPRIRLAIPPAFGRGRSELVRLVRRTGENVVAALGVGHRIVGRARAAEVVAGHDDPLVAFLTQHLDKVARVAHFGGEKSFRMVAQVGLAAPRLPPSLLENLQFLAEDRFGQERGQRVMIGEADEVQTGRTGRRFPPARFLGAVVPSAAVAQLADRTKLPHVVDERTGVTEGESGGAVQPAERVPRAALVGIDPVVDAENFGQIVFRMLLRAEAAVILARFEHDRVPGVLAALGLRAVAVPLRPVDRLVIVPEAGDINVAVGQAGAGEKKRGAEGKAEESGGQAHDAGEGDRGRAIRYSGSIGSC